MLRRVWDLAGCTTFAWLALVACGKTGGTAAEESGGASAATAGLAEGGSSASGAGNGSDAGSGSAGAAASTAGKQGASGGASGLGGGAPSGGTGDTRGGGPSSPEAGAGGEAGAPAPDCNNRYLSCGCGCCVGSTPPQRCVYPGVGKSIDELLGDDRALRNDTAGCAAAGCSQGVDYFCCEPPPPQPEVASYETSVYIGGVDRLRLYKRGAVNCSTFGLVSPQLHGEELPVELPTSWAIDQITRLSCTSSAIGPQAIGAIGKLSLRVSGDACVLDAHVTAFFPNAQGGVDAERFDAEDVPVNLSVAFCK